MTRSIDLPIDFVDAAKSCAEEFPTILAVDPGARCGVAILDSRSGVCLSATCKLDSIGQTIADVVGSFRVHLFAREAPFSITNAALASGRANAGALWSLGYAAGTVDAFARRWCRDSVRWEPQPVTWRSVLGLNAGDRSREAVNERVHAWACRATSRPLTTQRGAKLLDEANAVCLAFATAYVFKAARSGM